jgi:hypothetical protein
MKYYQGNNHSSRKSGGNNETVRTTVKWGMFIVFFIGLFVFSVYQFRSSGSTSEPSSENNEMVADERSSEQNESMQEETDTIEVAPGMPEIRVRNTTNLEDVRGGGGSGEAKRGTKDGVFYHTVTATLPEINREAYFYEGWLVRKVPFDYFSTGEMVTNKEGEFVLEWEGEEGENYEDYTEVVITLEPRDNDPSPAEHVLEGTFRE